MAFPAQFKAASGIKAAIIVSCPPLSFILFFSLAAVHNHRGRVDGSHVRDGVHFDQLRDHHHLHRLVVDPPLLHCVHHSLLLLLQIHTRRRGDAVDQQLACRSFLLFNAFILFVLCRKWCSRAPASWGGCWCAALAGRSPSRRSSRRAIDSDGWE